MNLLRANEEKLLKELISMKEDPIPLNRLFCILSELEDLEKQGYIKFKYKDDRLHGNFIAAVSVTESGKHYFEDKNQYLQEKRIEEKKRKKSELKTDVKFIISTLIAVAALAISIISLCIKL